MNRKIRLSLVTIAKNEEKEIGEFLENVRWVDEIIIVINDSHDRTAEIAKKYTKKIYFNSETSLGLLKRYALSKATGEWILILDVDERISEELKKEIRQILQSKNTKNAYSIQYQNHFLGYVLSCKAQTYSKIRLFQRGKGSVVPVQIHEEVEITGSVGLLEGKILHYSFKSIPQTLEKFTNYAKLETPLFIDRKDSVSFKHLMLYPLHMFWSIFVEDKGYKDGIWGFLLALCFAYYEFAKYFFLLIYKIRHRGEFPIA